MINNNLRFGMPVEASNDAVVDPPEISGFPGYFRGNCVFEGGEKVRCKLKALPIKFPSPANKPCRLFFC